MVADINPQDTVAKYTPRQSDMVDAAAAATRIAEQQMRSNPIENAVVTKGLTRFVGNYGSDFAWFGEITPYDLNLEDDFGNNMPQRGIVFVRDDPQHNSAFAMYDWNPQVGVPLRQRVSMHDADGKVVYEEGAAGGRGFPDQPLIMYQRETIDAAGVSVGADTIQYSGAGNLTGRRVDFQASWAAVGTVTVSAYLKLQGGGVTITTPTVVQSGAQNFLYDSIDVGTIFDATDFINIEWHAWRSAGTGTFFPRIYRCRTYSP